MVVLFDFCLVDCFGRVDKIVILSILFRCDLVLEKNEFGVVF